MLSIKAICKSENNEEVIIIGFELEGYCLCMTKSGTIFHAKHEDLTIVDKEYMESCAKGSIDFEMADFLEKASVRLDQIQSKQLTSIILELQEYRSKIEQGKMIELPVKLTEKCYVIFGRHEKYIKEVCVIMYEIGTVDKWARVIWYEGERKLWEDFHVNELYPTREEAEKRLKEIQE
jgi:phage pi2 protein 07